MLGGEDHEGDAEDCVGAGGEDTDLLRVEAVFPDAEGDLCALAAAYPVGLHGVDAVGPLDAGEVEELVGVLGDAEEPLLEVSAGYGGAAAFAGAIGEDLLVGEGGLAGRAPVGGGLVAVGEAGVEELEEEPLGPLVVVGEGGDDLSIPVVDGTDALELAAHVFDVAHGPDVGMDAVLDGGVLGGEAEGVEAHGVEDVVALHAAEAGMDVRGGHGVPVADVEVPRGVGEHGELVPLGLIGVFVDAVEGVGGPAVLPLGLYFGGVVSEGHPVLRSPALRVGSMQWEKLPRRGWRRKDGGRLGWVGDPAGYSVVGAGL